MSNPTRPPPLEPPTYRPVPRNASTLLTKAWSKDNPAVLSRLRSHPSEARDVTDDTRRTALHLAMFNHGCPPYVVIELLGCNPHASVARDAKGFTPLHYACQFGCQSDVLRLLCGAVVDVERRTTVRRGGIEPDLDQLTRPPERMCPPSPLLLACRRHDGIDIESLRLLIEYSELVEWIGPATGGEPWWWQGPARRSIDGARLQASAFGSPLRCLWASYVLRRDGHRRELMMALNSEIDARDHLSVGGGGEDFWKLGLLRLDRRARRQRGEEGVVDVDDNSDAERQERTPSLLFWEKVLLLLAAGQRRSLGPRQSEEDATATVVDFRSEQRSNQSTQCSSDSDLLRVGGTMTIQLLHVAAALLTPLPDLVRFVLELFPEQARQKDERRVANGDGGERIPLHHALMAYSRRHRPPRLSGRDKAKLGLEERMCDQPQWTFRILLEAHPEGAQVLDGEGRLPLALAVEAGLAWEDGLADLVRAVPEALGARDVKTHLYPFMLAAAVTCSTADGSCIDAEIEAVENVYQLLRACPENVK